MTYAQTYFTDDISDIAIDAISTMGVEVVGFAALIILVILAGWFVKNGKKIF